MTACRAKTTSCRTGDVVPGYMRDAESSKRKQRQKYQPACQTAGLKRSASKKNTLPAGRIVSQAPTKPSSLSKTSAKTTALRNASPTEAKSLEIEAPVSTIDTVSALVDEHLPTPANSIRFSQQRIPTPPLESSSPRGWQPNHPSHPPTPQPTLLLTPPPSPGSSNRSLEYSSESNTGVFDASTTNIYDARTSLSPRERPSTSECDVFDIMPIYGSAKPVLRPELPQLSRAVLTTCDARVHKPLTDYESSSATRPCNPGQELGIREEELDALSSAIFEYLLDAYDGRKGDLISAVEASLGAFY